ncbi:YecA family protein [Oceanobacillus iheyensis]|uniref:YecA family protein n=1 Tax=Oceanobacillus iheyensis TaxID=182710 RepID=UPI003629138A
MIENAEILSYIQELKQYSKVKLDKLRRLHAIPNASQLNKAKLAERLATEIPGSFEVTLTYLNKPIIDLFNDFQRNNGVIPVRVKTEELLFLQVLGLIFIKEVDDDEIAIMPRELLQVYDKMQSNELQKTAIRNTKWHKLTEGMLYYYGVMQQEILIAQVEKFTNEKIDSFEFLHVMKIAETMYQSFEIQVDKRIYIDFRVDDPDFILVEQSKRKQIPYYPFTEQELLQSSEDGFIPLTQGFKKLRKYILRNFDIEESDVLDILDNVIVISNMDQKPTAPLQYLNEVFEFNSEKQLQEFIPLVMNATNDVRLWMLKGHTPTEITQMNNSNFKELPKGEFVLQNEDTSPIKKSKIGRNDPCPCGSGKKYKKCCIA